MGRPYVCEDLAGPIVGGLRYAVSWRIFVNPAARWQSTSVNSDIHESDPINPTVQAEGDQLLAEIVTRLIAAYDPLFAYLFGSRARGDAGPESDYDIMIVVPDDASPRRRDSKFAYEVLWGLREAGDILVWTETRFGRSKHLRSSLPGTILREADSCMRPDPAGVDEATGWLRKAALGLRAAGVDLSAEPPLPGWPAAKPKATPALRDDSTY